MTAYRRGEKCYCRFPLRTGGTRIVSTGTPDRPTAKAMERMARALADREDWALLESVTRRQAVTARRQALRRLFDAYRSNALDTLRAELKDVDLERLIAPWIAVEKGRLSPGVAHAIEASVRTLMPTGTPFPRSRLTPATIAAWQARPPVDPTKATTDGRAMRVQRRYALTAFCRYLIDVAGVLAINPVKQVKGAGKAKPRVRWLDVDDMMRLIDTFAEPYRTLSALLHGAGLEISAALALRKRDIDPAGRSVHARGTKTADRDRVARIRPFAWPIIEAHIAQLLPASPLFPEMQYFQALRAHRKACDAAGIQGYTLHDARHSFAVQLLREGVPHALIAANLGHKDETELVKTYGRYRVETADWERWERRIAGEATPGRKAK